MTLDLLGKIGSRCKEEQLKHEKNKPNMTSISDSDSESEDSGAAKSRKEDEISKKLRKEIETICNITLDDIDKLKIDVFVYLSKISRNGVSAAAVLYARQYSLLRWFWEDRDIENKKLMYTTLFKKNPSEFVKTYESIFR